MKIRTRGKRKTRLGAQGYEPDVGPAPAAWLALTEQGRLDSIVAYHESDGIAMPSVHAHAAIHAVVENQLAERLEPVVQALDRLVREGLDRHDAVHAIGSVLSEQLFRALKYEEQPDTEEYFRSLSELSAEKWRAG